MFPQLKQASSLSSQCRDDTSMLMYYPCAEKQLVIILVQKQLDGVSDAYVKLLIIYPFVLADFYTGFSCIIFAFKS